MIDKLKQIFEENLTKENHYLLGLSGGGDSMFLFYALLKWGYRFDACVVDHGSRPQIAEEIAYLQKICDENEVELHIKQITEILPDSPNIEELYRQKRYALFEEVFQTKVFEKLLLGHHADDQIETVLKRILEGASIPALSGIAKEKKIGKMVVYRPLLSIRKREIISSLIKENKRWFEDETNQDCRYLRARMREKILPFLRDEFGKEFGVNLLHFAEGMERIAGYFDLDLQKPLSGPFGRYYFFPRKMNFVEADFYLRKVFENEGLTFSRGEVKRLAKGIEKGESNIKLSRCMAEVVLEKNGIFFANMDEVDPVLKEGDEEAFGWQAVVNGEVGLIYDDALIELKIPETLKERLPSGTTLAKHYSRFQVPSCLRQRVPAVYINNRLVGEVLTGKMLCQSGKKWVLTFMTKKNTISSFQE